MSSNPHRRLLAAAFGLASALVPAVAVAPLAAPAAEAAPAVALTPVDTWAWCGVHPDDPTAAAAARSMAVDSGIDVTFGPCNVPNPDYTPAFTSNRYVSPEMYRRLVDINAAAGMKTVVYDARIWSTDASVRSTALAFWAPVFSHIEAWDLGDEFEPSGSEWPILVQRWNLVRSQVTPASGIEPFVNHLYWATDEALRDLPGTEQLLSFTRYDGDLGASLARILDPQVATLMCGVNAFTHFGYTPDEDSIRADMAALRAAGCDQFLVFGGQQVYGTSQFGGSSLVDVATGEPTRWAPGVLEGSGRSSFHGVTPARLLETRTGPGLVTVDGQQNGVGRRGDGATSGVQVTGRAGVPAEVAAVSLDITAVDPSRAGFVTAYPCGETQPLAAQLNHGRATTISAALIVRPGADGRVCIFNMAETDLVVDVNGYVPIGAAFEADSPARLLETRTGEGYATVDGTSNGIGVRTGGSVTELQVTGRAGVPSAVNAVVLNVTVTGARAAGYVTVYPCGEALPTSSNLNYTLGSTITNAAVTATSTDGKVCLFTSAEVDLVVDLGGHLPLAAPISTGAPVRVLDSRNGPGLSTIDGLQFAIGARTADTVTRLPIAGRATIPAGTSAVVLGVTVTEPKRAGFVTVFPCNGARPAAANVNFVAGQTVANLVVADLADDGSICLYTMAGTHLVVDVLSALP
ncbi:MAG: hypothetical protein U0Q03_18530 [Acidimicrobiales bacterium]